MHVREEDTVELASLALDSYSINEHLGTQANHEEVRI